MVSLDLPKPPATLRGVELFRHTGRVSLRALVFVRWIVIVGQLFTVLLVRFGFGFRLPFVSLVSIIALALLVNLLGTITRRGRALSDPARVLFGPNPHGLGPGEEIRK